MLTYALITCLNHPRLLHLPLLFLFKEVNPFSTLKRIMRPTHSLNARNSNKLSLLNTLSTLDSTPIAGIHSARSIVPRLNQRITSWYWYESHECLRWAAQRSCFGAPLRGHRLWLLSVWEQAKGGCASHHGDRSLFDCQRVCACHGRSDLNGHPVFCTNIKRNDSVPAFPTWNHHLLMKPAVHRFLVEAPPHPTHARDDAAHHH